MMESKEQRIAFKILDTIFKKRKVIGPMAQGLDKTPPSCLPPEETDVHIKKIRHAISRQAPITMVLPAYPGKSPNRYKTLSKFMDLADKHSIDHLGKLCQEIGQWYKPGAKLLICSDGYVFSDLVRMPDEDVHTYTAGIKAYCQAHHPMFFDFYDLKDAYPKIGSLASMREELMIAHGESIIALKQKTKEDGETLSMHLGIAKFLFEDFNGLPAFTGVNNTQIQKRAREVSLRVIQRSNAWGRLLEDVFPGALRLSIHPQYRTSPKIGIKMGLSSDLWRTPWHSVAVMQGEGIYFEKRSVIDENKYRLVFDGGKPSHYTATAPTMEGLVDA